MSSQQSYVSPHHSYPQDGTAPAPTQGLLSASNQFSKQLSNPREPSPPSFSRPVPQYVVFKPFPMMVVYGGKELRDGFTEHPPSTTVEPHPFAAHDILEDDWLRFLTDLKAAAQLTKGENITANVLSATKYIGFAGHMISKAIEKKQTKKKQEPVGNLVDTWNTYFFRPRRVEVILAKDNTLLTEHQNTTIRPDLGQHIQGSDKANKKELYTLIIVPV